MSFFNTHDVEQMKKLAELIRVLNTTGHNPATSGNYSLRSTTSPDYAIVSESGVDKSRFDVDHFLPVFFKTREIHELFQRPGRKSSDETDIHLAIYESTNASCVLHSHKVEALLFANLFPRANYATIEGLELLKGLKGIKTHETKVEIPLFENTQDISLLADRIRPVLGASTSANERTYALILRGHGIYVWGDSVEDAKRHLEVFDYLFKYQLEMRRYAWPS